MTLEEFRKYSYKVESKEQALEMLQWIVKQGGGLCNGRTPEVEVGDFESGSRYIEKFEGIYGLWSIPDAEKKTYSWWKEQIEKKRS